VKEGTIKTEDGSYLDINIAPDNLPNLENAPQNEELSTFSASVLNLFKKNIQDFTDNDISFQELAGGKVLIIVTYFNDKKGNEIATKLLEQVSGQPIDGNSDELSVVVELQKLPSDVD
jgi:hypothetical protein